MKKVNFYNISKINRKYEKNFIKNFRIINKKGISRVIREMRENGQKI